MVGEDVVNMESEIFKTFWLEFRCQFVIMIFSSGISEEVGAPLEAQK